MQFRRAMRSISDMFRTGESFSTPGMISAEIEIGRGTLGLDEETVLGSIPTIMGELIRFTAGQPI
jgi:hypothetical protein